MHQVPPRNYQVRHKYPIKAWLKVFSCAVGYKIINDQLLKDTNIKEKVNNNF